MREKTMLRTMLLAIIGMLVGWSATTPAHAIPAFARKYQTSCARCHTAYPKLNSYGESFKLRGYQTLGEEQVDVDVIDTNDPLLDLPADLPLSFSFQTVLHARRGEPFDFQTPTGISLLLGATLAPEVGVLAQYSPGGGLDKLNLIFANLLRTENEPTSLNAVVGQFELMDFVASYHRPLTMGGYAIYNTRVGNWTLGGQERGIMLYGTVGSGIGVEAPQEDAGPQAGAAGEVTAEELEMLAREFEEAEETQVPETPVTVADTYTEITWNLTTTALKTSSPASLTTAMTTVSVSSPTTVVASSPMLWIKRSLMTSVVWEWTSAYSRGIRWTSMVY